MGSKKTIQGHHELKKVKLKVDLKSDQWPVFINLRCSSRAVVHKAGMPRWYRRCRCSGSSSRGRPTSGRGCSRCCIIINAVPVKNQVPSSDRRISVEVKGERVRVDKEYIPAAWLSTKVLMLATGTLAVFNFWRQFHATWSVE